MKFTKWFPWNIDPVRVGVYQRKYKNGEIRYCWWNGSRFCAGESHPYPASVYQLDSLMQSLPWRGIAK